MDAANSRFLIKAAPPGKAVGKKLSRNAVTQQHWIARDNQRPSLDDGYDEGYYEIDVPASEREGVRREPTKRVIRVVMPRGEGGS